MEDNQSKIRKALSNEIVWIVGIIAGVYSLVSLVIFPIRSIGQDMENIKTNHLHTIELAITELKALQAEETKENSAEHLAITKQLERTATILDQHLINTK
jgi:hypothetical protein